MAELTAAQIMKSKPKLDARDRQRRLLFIQLLRLGVVGVAKQRVRPPDQMPCAFVYQHSDGENAACDQGDKPCTQGRDVYKVFNFHLLLHSLHAPLVRRLLLRPAFGLEPERLFGADDCAGALGVDAGIAF